MLELECALRLRRSDVLRLSDVHRRQFAISIARGNDAAALDFIESDDGDDDVHGLVYVRLVEIETKRAYEGFLLDDARYPNGEARPDGGLFFDAGTTDFIGIEMSQGGFSASGSLPELCDAFAALLRAFPVTVRGPALKKNPPFAHATVPKVQKPPKPKKGEVKPLPLEVVRARRYTESEIRAAPPEVRFRCMYALRPKFATKTTDGMDDFLVMGIVYSSIDPGTDVDRAFIPGGARSALLQVELAVKDDPSRTFEGWFFDDRRVAESYWPSPRAKATRGRCLIGGTTQSAGIEIIDGKVRVDRDATSLQAHALAAGLEKLGLAFAVEVAGDTTRPGYVGSIHHEKQRAFERGPA